MSDPGANQEKYCSSYYDKHGLYNDGFPCPVDKYCCQSADGNKMCCPILKSFNEKQQQQQQQPSIVHYPSSSTHSSHLLNTLSSFGYSSNRPSNNFKQTPTVSYISFLFSNSNLVIVICTALVLLVILGVLLLIFVCRYLNKRMRNSNQRNHRNQQLKCKKNLPFSRNSSSSCSSTSGTSSSSTSPKTNQLTICCDDDIGDEHQKILSQNTTNNNLALNLKALRQQPLSNNSSCDLMQKSALLSSNLAALLGQNQFNLMSQSNHGTLAKASFSSGSSNVALLHSHLNSANTTQTSFVTSSNQHTDQNANFAADLADFVMNEEDDEADFIVSTSSNLEFLKTHSLFNSTPLNYYPSLKNTKQREEDAMCPIQTSTQLNQANNNNNNNNVVVDFRFSTFLPPLFMKTTSSSHEEAL